MQRLSALKPLMESTSKRMPKQAFFVKSGQDVTVIPLTGARRWGLASMIAECGGCQAEYQDSEFTDEADGGNNAFNRY